MKGRDKELKRKHEVMSCVSLSLVVLFHRFMRSRMIYVVVALWSLNNSKVNKK